ncbi:Methylamine utilisation protein MauE [Lentzea xinjiangensis]|uniref:Methylamine utilisation protein MauE n=1 Tax=Lentzea xinjiangensis TaxID=402600 RepID=A0A1H9D8V4_9PSEU|nr:MauE/DoxX family redox-associated membrane protein [Lentzea xinjiangensis]SEQ09915.1 Methylamine utilisation protein MauE [Lentzea xinjiangensis]
MSYVLVACRLCLGLVFLVSAVSKVRGRKNFAEFVRATGELAPPLPAKPAATAVVAAEVAVVALLCTPWAATGFLVGAGLLTAFTVAVVTAIVRGRQVRCQCFGNSSAPVSWFQVARNALLLSVAAAGLLAGTVALDVPLEIGGVLVALAAGAVTSAVALLTDEIAVLFGPAH